MASPPAKKCKESKMISMVVETWREGQIDQSSSVHRINGFPWRLRLYKSGVHRLLQVACDMADEAKLWECTVTLKASFGETVKHTFKSWDPLKYSRFRYREFSDGMNVNVEVVSNCDGERWRRISVLDPFKPRDGILVIEGEKFHVDKESLSSQSSFFDRLFNGEFKEKNMVEIPIEDVEYEEFKNILKLVYGFNGASITDRNVRRVLELADSLQMLSKVCFFRFVGFGFA